LPTDKQQSTITGRVLGEFIVREKLGEGGFGQVYRAEQLTLGREAVIKVLHKELTSDSAVVERFVQEARLASSLEHPYVAHIYAFGVEQDALMWIAMEYVRGTPLDRLLHTQGALPLERFVPVLEKICEVVQTAHEMGIIHRDIKPANVMVISRAGRLLPKLLDFGIAKGIGKSPRDASISPNTLRTLRLRNSISVTHKPSDIADSLKTNDGSKARNSSEPEVVPPEVALDLAIQSAAEPVSNVPESIGISRGISEKIDNLQLENVLAEQGDVNLPTVRVTGDTKKKSSLSGSVNNFINDNSKKTEGLVGSPPYMAPEQWAEEDVTAQTDIYALGVLSYEVLAGYIPFSGDITKLAYCHMIKPVPPLPAPFSSEVSAVIAKAMSKAATDRYQSATELAQAFRRAAGIIGEQGELPRINEELRDIVLLNMPWPIARALAELGKINNPLQAREQVRQIFRIVVRFLGVLSLACWVRIRQELRKDRTMRAMELLDILYHQRLNEEEWLELAQELTRPFYEYKDAHPMPELVLLLGSPVDDEQSYAKVLTQQVYKLFRGGRTQTISLDEPYRQLGELLQRTLFLTEYPILVGQPDSVEWWMGITQVQGRLPEVGNLPVQRPLLADIDGRIILELWPFINKATPTPELPAELFLFEGRGRNGARFVAWPSEFERQEEDFLDWFAREVLDAKEEIEALKLTERLPYPGLSTFTSEDADLFFGREKDIEIFMNRLKVQSFLAIVGPSGAGKSSFVQAGIIPRLPAEWRKITIRPGSAPITTLQTILYKEFNAPLLDLLTHPSSLRHYLLKHVSEGLLLVVDQFEEIVTLCLNLEEREAYCRALAEAVQVAEERIRIVLTMRDDFLLKIKELPGIGQNLTARLELLTTPGKDDLIRILVEPARRAGYRFEDPNLPSEIAQSVIGLPGALPLLAFTAAKLWTLRDIHLKLLRRKEYEAIGGVGGALAQHAQELLQQMTQAEQRIVREAFRRLVTSEGTRAVLTKKDLTQVLGNSTESNVVLEKLVTARLLSASEGEEGREQVEIIHEALLSAWPQLVKWRQEDAEGARLRDQLQAASRQWQDRGRPEGLLWRGDALLEYELWRPHYPGRLTEIEEAFAQASLAEASRIKRLKQLATGVSISVLLIGLVVLFMQRQEAQRRLLNLYEEQGRQELLAGRIDRALIYFNQAYQLGNNSVGLRFMLAQALQKYNQVPLPRLMGHSAALQSVTFSPDGQRIVTAAADATANVYQADTGKLVFTLTGHRDTVNSASYSMDGRQIVTAGSDGLVIIWDANTGKQIRTITGHQGAVNMAAFSNDGKFLVSAGIDRQPKLWEVATGKLVLTLEGHTSNVLGACFSPNGQYVVTCGHDWVARVWDSKTGTLLQTFTGHQGSVNKAIFTPDNTRLITASSDNTVRIWAVSSAKQLAILDEHRAEVNSVVCSNDGERLVTSSNDRTIKVWDVASGKVLLSLLGELVVNSVAISPDGQRLAAGGDDQTTQLWAVGLELPDNAALKQLIATKVDLELKDERLEPVAAKTASPATANQTFNAQNATPLPVALQLQKFSFPVVTLDRNGEVIRRENQENEYFTEDLGQGVRLEMARIAAGEFMMGSPENEDAREDFESPQHRVTMSEYFMGKFEVTQAQWEAIMGTNPSRRKSANRPVDSINWFDAVEFCHRLSEKTGRLYRLPTEAEWEYACRAGTTTAFHFGDTITPDLVNYDGNYPYRGAPRGGLRGESVDVGSLKVANAFGLYDMHGNVLEWCLDRLHANYLNAPSDGRAWELPYEDNENVRILRGGAWNLNADNCRSAYRYRIEPGFVNSIVGFRVVVRLPQNNTGLR
jgi:formylglycine-generating enzyme required for sulfatase activity/WD40 repeat protein/serine/threonine protein kinase